MADPVANGFLPFPLGSVSEEDYPTLRVGKRDEQAQISLENANFNLEDNHSILFDGNGKIGAIGNLSFLTGESSGIYISPNGHVGVGNPNPQFTLDVQGTINATQFYKGGTPWKVTGNEIESNTITAANIQNGAITRDKLDPSISFDLADDAVTTPKIANGAVTRDKLDPSIPLGGDSLWESDESGGIYNRAGNFVGILGAIMPSVGNSETAGIMFPKDAFGGSGDAAWIRCAIRSS